MNRSIRKEAIKIDGILVGYRLFQLGTGVFGTDKWIGYEWLESNIPKEAGTMFLVVDNKDGWYTHRLYCGDTLVANILKKDEAETIVKAYNAYLWLEQSGSAHA